MDAGAKLTAERLRSLLIYDPATGIFTRRVSRQGFHAGTQAGVIHKASGYVYIGVDRKRYRAHRLAWLYMTGEWPVEIDHDNTIRSDNRWSNLREATRSQNNANAQRRADNTSGHKGVSWVARVNRWRAYITSHGRQCHLGYFRDYRGAIDARDAAFQQQFGEFARL